MNAVYKISGSINKIYLIAAPALALCFGSTSMAQAQSIQPSLNLVSVGISKYKMAPLQSPHKDAIDMASLMRGQQGKLFSQVNSQLLLDEQATVRNIRGALSKAATQANVNSYTVLFMAGHGGNFNAKKEFEFMGYDGKISWSGIQVSLNNLPGKVIVIIDSCFSGSLTSGGNMIVFSSSLANQVSGETLQNGYFTQALLEGLNGKADMDHNGIITLAEADAYVSGRLEQISFGKQSSTLLRPVNTPSSMPLVNLNPMFGSTPVAGQPNFSPMPQPSFGPGAVASK